MGLNSRLLTTYTLTTVGLVGLSPFFGLGHAPTALAGYFAIYIALRFFYRAFRAERVLWVAHSFVLFFWIFYLFLGMDIARGLATLVDADFLQYGIHLGILALLGSLPWGWYLLFGGSTLTVQRTRALFLLFAPYLHLALFAAIGGLL